MLKRIIGLMVCFLPVFTAAQNGAIQGHSFLGGTKAVTSGLSSTNYLNGIIPYAKITVYLTGTTTLATIYSNATGTPLDNPFTSNTATSVDPGGWIFWAAINQGLDVVMSGGVSPNTYRAPVTISDVYPSTHISSGCGFGTVCPISQGGTGATTAAGANLNITGVTQTGTLGTSSQVSTFSGTVAANTTNSGTINNVLYAGTAQYPTIASAIAALPSTGGTVRTPPGYTETMATLALGSSTKPVTLIGGAGTLLTINGGSGTSGLQVFNGSAMLCDASVGGGGCELYSTQTTPLSLLTNGQQDGTQEYFYVNGWTVNCGYGPVYTNGCVYIDGVFAPSTIENSSIYGFYGSIGLHITSTVSTAGGTNVFNLNNIWVVGTGQSGEQPLVIDRSGTGVVSAISFYGGSIENPGATSHAIYINGAGSLYQMQQINFYGTQVQGNAAESVAAVFIQDAQGVSINGMMGNGISSTYPMVELNETVTGALQNISIQGVSGNHLVSVLKNDVSGYSSTVGQSLLAPYWYQGSSTTRLTLDGQSNFLTPVNSAQTAYGPAFVTGPQLVYNNTMAGSGTAATGWYTAADGSAACTFLVDTSTAPTGQTQSQKMQLTNSLNTCEVDSNHSPGSPFVVTSGNTYSVGVWLRNDGSSIGATVGLGSNAGAIVCAPVWTAGNTATGLTTTWTHFQGQCKATGTTSSAGFTAYTQLPGVNGSVWVSYPQVSLLSAPSSPNFTSTTILPTSGNGVNAATTADTSATGAGYLETSDGSGNISSSGVTLATIPTTICSYHAISSANTGSTTENAIYNCAVPAGTMGVNSRLESKFFESTGGSNTGNCSLRVRWSTTSGSVTGTLVGYSATSGTYTTSYTATSLFNAGSLSSQLASTNGYGTISGNVGSNVAASLSTGTATTYLTITLQNSVSADSCYVGSGSVVLWPNG